MGKEMIGSYFCLRNSIMIELKKHFVQEMEELSFSDLCLSFETITQSKSIKRSIVMFKRTIIVKNKDEPFFEYFLEHDQRFMRKILPLLYTDEVTQIRIVSSFASDVLEKRDGKKAIEAMCDKRLSAINRVKTLIGAYSVCSDEGGYVCIHPLRWFGMEIVNTILLNEPIILMHYPICSPSIARILGEQFCRIRIDVYEEDIDPATFGKKIFDTSTTSHEMFHDIINMLYLTSDDPEAAIKKFVNKNANKLSIINRCEPFLLEYLPMRIRYMIRTVVWGYPCDESSSTSSTQSLCELVME